MLQGRKRYILKQYIYEISYWMFIMLIFIFVRFGGSSALLNELNIFYGPADFTNLLIGTLIGSILLGIILSTIRQFYQRDFCKSMSVGSTILVSSFIQLIVFLLLISLFMTAELISLGYTIATLDDFLFHEYHLSSVVLMLLTFFYASIQFGLILEAEKKLGINVLGNLLLGKYHLPKQETRIFMFLDMKDSTKIAESLGHLRYSRLLQEIFRLLTDLVIDFKAEIYQFVGDEVVLTWKSDEGHQNNNTLRFFYAFQAILLENSNYFKTHYDVSPIFKAGVHQGEVSVAEVGEISTQIAYHGDVVNTTSRIQELCNEFNTNLLISDRFMEKMIVIPTDFKENSANISLRGRSETVTIYTPDESFIN